MTDPFAHGLVLPALFLAGMGFCVPRVLALFWPEGVRWLVGLAFISTLILALLGAGFFALLYARLGVDLYDLYGTQGLGTVLHFGRLNLISALMWAPLMIFSLLGVPKNWVKEVW